MDNLTHTLIGVLVGETVAHRTRHQAGLTHPQRRTLLVAALAIGSNVPDFDLVISGSKLDYLLHHRGYTHTLVGTLLAALLVYLACECWMRWRKLSPSPGDRRSLALAAVLAPLLHLAMDMTNNYGVHPWWPVDNRWHYGDTLFIIEPLLWTLAAPLAFTLQSRLARASMVLILAIGVGLVFFAGMVPMTYAIGYTALIAVLLRSSQLGSTDRRVAIGLSVWFVVTCAFLITHQVIARRVDSLAADTFPEAQLLDRVLTPMPVNLLCWELILVQRETNALTLRRAMISLAPEWIAAHRCPGRALNTPTTASLQTVTAPDTSALQWYGQVSTSLEQLRSMWESNCRVDAFMRFARAPWLQQPDQGWVIGDLRYDREPELGFAELALDAAGDACPDTLPPWRAPLELLAPDHLGR